MKWGKKKSAISPTSIINRFFPVSWFSRLGQKFSISETNNFPNPNKSLRGRRFYSMDEDDAYWGISFGQETIQQGRRSTGGINPLWYDDYDREFEFPVSRFQSLDLGNSREEECQKFNEMVSDIKRMKEKQKNTRNGDSEITKLKGNDLNVHRIARERRREESEDGKIRVSNLGEKDIFPVELDNTVHKHGRVPKIQNFHPTPVKVKTEPPKKTKNKSRAKAYSPRSECKIRALEDMKKARIKCKKRGTAVMEDGKTVFDSFAVVKTSYDPQKDFRDSMMEMIKERGIWRHEELEELLACYLNLNCDEYHDLIIKVFRQVWFELGNNIL